MNYGSCSCCNKIIRYENLSLCEDCKNNFLHKVKDYIYDNGIHTSKEIYEKTGVPVRVIEFFLNNGYLTDISKVDIENEKKLEDEDFLKKLALLESLKDSFNTVVEDKEELKGEMYFLGRNRGK